jgi:hypothetical protein
MQVDKVIGCDEFLEADVSHCPIDLGPDPFKLRPFLLDFLMRLLGHFFLVFDQILYMVDAAIPLFKDKFVSADTDQSPQIHLDLE